jgi:hypothetical protein
MLAMNCSKTAIKMKDSHIAMYRSTLTQPYLLGAPFCLFVLSWILTKDSGPTGMIPLEELKSDSVGIMGFPENRSFDSFLPKSRLEYSSESL